MHTLGFLCMTLLLCISGAESSHPINLRVENVSLVNIDLTYHLRWSPVVIDGHNIVYNVSASYDGDSHRTLLTASTETDCRFNVPVGDEYYNWKFTVDAISDGVIRASGSKSFDDLTASEASLKVSSPQVNLTVLECGNISVSLVAPWRLEPLFLEYIVRFPCLVDSCSTEYKEERIKYELGTHTTRINRLLPAAQEYCVEANLGVYYGNDVRSDWTKVCKMTDCPTGETKQLEPTHLAAIILSAVFACVIIVLLCLLLRTKYFSNFRYKGHIKIPASTRAMTPM